MSRPGFWSEPVRLWLIACGRQDLVDRGDAFAQRVTALLVAVRQRADQYLEHDDLYSGAGGDGPATADPAEAVAALAELDEFVNVRLRQEMSVLEQMLAVFDDLRSRRTAPGALSDLCEALSKSVSDENVVDFIVGADMSGRQQVLILTVTDPGPPPVGLTIGGYPLSVARAPRSLRRRIFSRSI